MDGTSVARHAWRMQPPRPPDLPTDHPGRPLLARLEALARCEIVAPEGIRHGLLIGQLRQMIDRNVAPGPRDGPLILSPFAHLARLLDPAEALAMLSPAPPEALDRIRAGQGQLVLDGASEGRAFRGEEAAILHAALEAAGIPAERTVWVQQNRALGPDYRAWSVARGVASMRIVTGDAYALGLWHRLFAPEIKPLPGEPPPRWPFGFALASDRPRRNRWICLNYVVRAHRAVLAAWLLAREEPGHLTFSVKRIEEDEAARRRFARDATWLARVEPGLSPRVEALLASGMDRTGDTEAFAHSHWRVHSLPMEEVAASELFIVTETEMVWPNLHRWTEKTLKALASGLPFIVFGNHGTVAGLAELGFDTLPDLVDHGYDAEPAPDRRFAAALGSVARFLGRAPGFTPAEMARLRLAARHNREVFARQILRVAALDPIDEILAAARAP